MLSCDDQVSVLTTFTVNVAECINRNIERKYDHKKISYNVFRKRSYMRFTSLKLSRMSHYVLCIIIFAAKPEDMVQKYFISAYHI